MLTDIFAYRYSSEVVWDRFDTSASAFLVQCFRVIKEQLRPSEGQWSELNDRLSMELGLQGLSASSWGYWTKWNGNDHWMSGKYSTEDVCKNFVIANFDPAQSTFDQFMKARISFVELAFRLKEPASKVDAVVDSILAGMTRIPRHLSQAEAKKYVEAEAERRDAEREKVRDAFRAACAELNERLRRAGYPFHYHNGFIQHTGDALVERTISEPFWDVVANEKWTNVDGDMKEAIDRRDGSRRDAVVPATNALESAIKIISNDKGWTTGNEHGAVAYIENLFSGGFIADWERDSLKRLFGDLRNPFAHGPGDAARPTLSPNQTNYGIESCMSWIKSLVTR